MINFSEKAEDLGYGLMRIAVYVRRKDFRSRLEDLAMDLVLQTTKKDYEEALLTIGALEAFLRLGAAIFEIEIINAQTFIAELQSLQSAMRQSAGLELPESVNWQKAGVDLPHGSQSAILRQAQDKINRQSFGNPSASSGQDQSASSGQDQSAMRQEGEIADTATAIADDDEFSSTVADQLPDQKQDGMISIGNTIRQTAIIEKIRALTKKDEFGNLAGCRMKDLLAVFPTVSERTLRYDLQRLLSLGMIERVGNGGATSAYVIK